MGGKQQVRERQREREREGKRERERRMAVPNTGITCTCQLKMTSQNIEENHLSAHRLALHTVRVCELKSNCGTGKPTFSTFKDNTLTKQWNSGVWHMEDGVWDVYRSNILCCLLRLPFLTLASQRFGRVKVTDNGPHLVLITHVTDVHLPGK